jgi:sugar diacid utilization regulator
MIESSTSHLGSMTEHVQSVHVRMVNAVLAGEGLERVARLAAEAAGRTVAIVIPRLGAAVASSAELDTHDLRRHVNDRRRDRPPGVATTMPILAGDEVIGAVMLGGAQAPTDEALELLRVTALASLTEVAVEEARSETEDAVRGSFLEELRSGVDLPAGDIVRRAGRLGCDLSLGLVALCVRLTSARPSYVVAKIACGYPGALAQHIHVSEPGRDAGAGRVYALLPAAGGDGTRTATLAAARRLAGELRRHGRIGFSSFHADPGKCARAIQEAELVLDVPRRSELAIAEDLDSSTYRLLLRVLASHPDELHAFFEDTVAPIVDYDARHTLKLIETLGTYLQQNCNMNATAAATYTHRHTVADRLDRIKRLTGLDPMQHDDRERLSLGLKVYWITSGRVPR